MSWCISPRFAMFGNLRWTFMLLHIYTNKFRVDGVKVASVLFSISILHLTCHRQTSLRCSAAPSICDIGSTESSDQILCSKGRREGHSKHFMLVRGLGVIESNGRPPNRETSLARLYWRHLTRQLIG